MEELRKDVARKMKEKEDAKQDGHRDAASHYVTFCSFSL